MITIQTKKSRKQQWPGNPHVLSLSRFPRRVLTLFQQCNRVFESETRQQVCESQLRLILCDLGKIYLISLKFTFLIYTMEAIPVITLLSGTQ